MRQRTIKKKKKGEKKRERERESKGGVYWKSRMPSEKTTEVSSPAALVTT